MISFKEILQPGCARIGVNAETKDQALAAAVACLEASGIVPNQGTLLGEVQARERLSSTSLGEGVAVPHALCDSLGSTAMSAIRLAVPIPFQDINNLPVDLIFLLVGPKSDTAGHLRLLSKLVRILHDPEFRRAARAADSPKAFATLLYERD